ncbi:uncharacterized protein PGTG_07798 [Puccinia graminis f. sp. tritici CRL 75-36-700-3]|uniref:Uncharacterized protein n=1 Tax=Puccinia graminis f. sp. tritici (strain CRL 75-36-700-3 / race SCCL) TaxID=418459 RepID=E3KB06_PUCGT|nr:uncharacterized protein PGTG_07798 [Puccinia graminis f. sp. tritici CRL 75-36-700-3]EFP81549.2 hypothetical protein PGTG_07798 [Puccinia graminis f. sp. tritici CRL 75-36-700-3]
MSSAVTPSDSACHPSDVGRSRYSSGRSQYTLNPRSAVGRDPRCPPVPGFPHVSSACFPHQRREHSACPKQTGQSFGQGVLPPPHRPSMDPREHTSGNLLSADGLGLHSYDPLTNSTYSSLGQDDRMHHHGLHASQTNIEVSGGHYGTPSQAIGSLTGVHRVGGAIPSGQLSYTRTAVPATPPSGILTMSAPARIDPISSSVASARLKSSSTRKQNRTRAEIDAAKAVTAAKKAEKIQRAAQMLEAQRQKQAAKEARAALKVTDTGTPTPRFVWSEDASLELLRFVKEVKEEHDDLSERTPGFIAWSPYFLNREADRDLFPLLIGIANDVILRRYRALMNVWKVVFDRLSHLGSNGLHDVLAKEHLSETLYNFMNAMHGDNAAANAYGHIELDDDLGALVDDVGPEETVDGQASVMTNTALEDAQLVRDRRGVAGLTAAELVLDDSDNNGADVTSPNGPTPPSIEAPVGPGVVITKPPPATPHPSRQRGRTKVTKPDDSSTQALLQMFQQSQDRQEAARVEDCRLADVRANEKESARAAAATQAAHDCSIRDGQLKLDRDVAEKRNQALDEERRVPDEDRKEEKRQALEWRQEEGRRYEASQKLLAEERKVQDTARREQERASQLFQAAMMRMLGVQDLIPSAGKS